MTIFAPMRRMFGGKAQQGSTASAATAIFDRSRDPSWGDDRYERFSREFYARNSMVYACVNEIATSGSEAPLRVRDTSDPVEPEWLQGPPLADLIEQPNPAQSIFEFTEMLITYLQIAGNNYTFKLRGPLGQVVGLYNLVPTRVRVVPQSGMPPDDIGYVYVYGGERIPIASADIIHIKLPNPTDGALYGLSPLHVLNYPVSTLQAIQSLQKVTFDNGGMPGMQLKLHRAFTDDDEPERLRAAFRSRFGMSLGGEFAQWGRLAVFEGDAELSPVTNTLDTLALPQLTALNELDICRAFGVPSLLVQASLAIEHGGSLGGSNYQEARRSLWDETLSPLYVRIGSAMTRGLRGDFATISRGAWVIEPDKSRVQALQEDVDKRAARFAMLFEKGGCKRNEFRTAVGLDPEDGPAGDAYRVPAGVMELTIDDLNAGAAGQSDVLWDKGIATLNETREAFGYRTLPGGDVRQMQMKAIEQSTDELAAGVTPAAPAHVAFAGTLPPTMLPPGTEDWPEAPDEEPAEPPSDAPPPDAGTTLTVVPPAGDATQPPAAPPQAQAAARAQATAKARLTGARAERFKRAMETVREAQVTAASRDITRFYRSVSQRASGVLGGKMRFPEMKAAPTPDELLPSGADGDLAAVVRAICTRTSEAVWNAVNDTGVAGEVDYDATHPTLVDLLAQAQIDAVGINDTVRSMLQELLSVGTERGYSIAQLANGVPDDGYPGLRSTLTEAYQGQAERIARTEVGRAALAAQRARYDAGGLSQVEAQDGTDDPECAARNGQVYSLDEASGIEDHPNGTLNWLPVIGEG